jgi:hypothetical protein
VAPATSRRPSGCYKSAARTAAPAPPTPPTIAVQLDQAEAAIERYLGAFEAGTLPEAQCGKRLQALGAKLADLQAHELELQQALAASAT